MFGESNPMKLMLSEGSEVVPTRGVVVEVIAPDVSVMVTVIFVVLLTLGESKPTKVMFSEILALPGISVSPLSVWVSLRFMVLLAFAESKPMNVMFSDMPVVLEIPVVVEVCDVKFKLAFGDLNPTKVIVSDRLSRVAVSRPVSVSGAVALLALGEPNPRNVMLSDSVEVVVLVAVVERTLAFRLVLEGPKLAKVMLSSVPLVTGGLPRSCWVTEAFSEALALVLERLKVS
jgi:hypothetical protein